ncbi:MAG: MaoC/PaaZ C-terminal domain-containing protein [Candidatus Nanopelagicales bacterium]
MTAAISFDAVEVGTALPDRDVTITRVDLIRYAGASGDFNVIHWNRRIATAVGLPDVIAHGMYTMAQAGRLVTDWIQDPSALVEFGVRFTRPVPVPDDDAGAIVRYSALVAEKLPDRRVRLDIKAVHADATVLGRASAVVQLA